MKNTRPYPLDKRSGWQNFCKTFWQGKPPKIDDQSISGEITPALKRKLTITVDAILNEKKTTAIKFGKTGDAPIRSDYDDYRGTYKEMKLLYCSEDKKNVSTLESHYIKKYKKSNPDKIDNIHEHSGGRMYSYDGYYYLYVVIR